MHFSTPFEQHGGQKSSQWTRWNVEETEKVWRWTNKDCGVDIITLSLIKNSIFVVKTTFK